MDGLLLVTDEARISCLTLSIKCLVFALALLCRSHDRRYVQVVAAEGGGSTAARRERCRDCTMVGRYRAHTDRHLKHGAMQRGRRRMTAPKAAKLGKGAAATSRTAAEPSTVLITVVSRALPLELARHGHRLSAAGLQRSVEHLLSLGAR